MTSRNFFEAVSMRRFYTTTCLGLASSAIAEHIMLPETDKFCIFQRSLKFRDSPAVHLLLSPHLRTENNIKRKLDELVRIEGRKQWQISSPNNDQVNHSRYFDIFYILLV